MVVVARLVAGCAKIFYGGSPGVSFDLKTDIGQ